MITKNFILKSTLVLFISCCSFSLFAQEWIFPGATEVDPIWRPAQVGLGMMTPPNPQTIFHIKSNPDSGGGSVLFEGIMGNTPINGSGTRLMWIPEKKAFRAGEVLSSEWDDYNIGYHSTAMGFNTTASGGGSVAIGWDASATHAGATAFGVGTSASARNTFAVGANSQASGTESVAIGNGTRAQGVQSTAAGNQTTASGAQSTALGHVTKANGIRSMAGGDFSESNGDMSFAMGRYVLANALSSTALGSFNVGNGNPTQWIANDPIFEVGIGTGINFRKNALTILKNGNLGVNTVNPQHKLHVANTGWGGSIDLRVDGRIQTGNSSQMGGVWLNRDHQMFVGQKDSNVFGFWSSGIGWNTMGINRNTGNVGIGTSPSYCKLTVNGSACKPGGGSWSTTSDRRLKSNIKSYKDGLETLLAIEPVSYHYNEKSGHDTGKEYIGVIAQDLNEVAPYMVGNFEQEGEKYYNVDNSAMTYMLINAVKEQQNIIENHAVETNELKAEIAELKAAVLSICNEGCGNVEKRTTQKSTSGIKYSEQVQLEQNAPNPFNTTTTIGYFLPKEVNSAALLVYDLQGKQLKSYEITETGKGLVKINAGDLSGGMYLYSLLVDGKPFTTLKMILTE